MHQPYLLLCSYYNNYNADQPRYFCRACQRHWTSGGSLRNVDPGASRRTARKGTTITSSSTPGAQMQQDAPTTQRNSKESEQTRTDVLASLRAAPLAGIPEGSRSSSVAHGAVEQCVAALAIHSAPAGAAPIRCSCLHSGRRLWVGASSCAVILIRSGLDPVMRCADAFAMCLCTSPA